MELRCQYSMHKTSIVSNVIKKARSEEIDEFKQKICIFYNPSYNDQKFKLFLGQ